MIQQMTHTYAAVFIKIRFIDGHLMGFCVFDSS